MVLSSTKGFCWQLLTSFSFFLSFLVAFPSGHLFEQAYGLSKGDTERACVSISKHYSNQSRSFSSTILPREDSGGCFGCTGQ